MKNQKGITLIALIITIIVMMILVAVSVNVALNGGLFESAKTASGDNEKEAILEQIVGMAEWDSEANIDVEKVFEKVITAYGSDKVNPNTLSEGATEVIFKVTGKTGTYKYKITTKEIKIDYGEDEDLKNLKEYVLGKSLTGRDKSEIFDNENFKNDSETIADAETSIQYIKCYNIGFCAKYKGKMYNILTDNSMTKDVKLVYEPKGKEGEDLGQVLNDSQYSGWIILYDHGNGKYEAVSPTEMGNLTLGYKDSTIDWSDSNVFAEANIDGGETIVSADKSIYSFNHAIGTINTYCKNLQGLPSNSQVRSVGARNETNEMYDDFESWCTYDMMKELYGDKVKDEDFLYENDLFRMSFWEVDDSHFPTFWVASRSLKVVLASKSNGLILSVRSIKDGSLTNTNITLFHTLIGILAANVSEIAVRPIIII